MISFIIPGVPKSKGRPRFVPGRNGRFGHAITDSKTRAAEESFENRAWQFKPAAPIEGPVRLEVTFVMPIPGSWAKWLRDAALEGRYRHTSKPDADNLAKLVKDACNGMFWKDDSQVCQLVVAKVYGAVAETRVTIAELEQPTKPERAVSGMTASLFGGLHG